MYRIIILSLNFDHCWRFFLLTISGDLKTELLYKLIDSDAKLTLDWYNHEDCGDADEASIADLLIENISHDQGGERCRPHMMNKDGDEIESVDIIGY